jgi:regulator of sigma E protease
MSPLNLAVTILGVSFLIILHELGHFGVARLLGLRVQRFSIGFGPTLLSIQWGETIWQVAAVPLGGYVQVAGMGPREDGEEEDQHSYRHRPGWQRSLVLFAGPAMNWLLAAALLTTSAWTVGLARVDQDGPATIGNILADGPAAKAGLASGDVVTAVNGEAVKDWGALVHRIRVSPNQSLSLSIMRSGKPETLSVTPEMDRSAGYAVIRVLPWAKIEQLGPWDGMAAGFAQAADSTVQQVTLLWGMVTGRTEGRLSGLPGIVKMVAGEAQRGVGSLLGALSWLSIGLFLLNLLPIPALDGSRLVFLVVEVVRRRPLDERIEGIVHGVGFALLLALMVLISVRDLL